MRRGRRRRARPATRTPRPAWPRRAGRSARHPWVATAHDPRPMGTERREHDGPSDRAERPTWPATPSRAGTRASSGTGCRWGQRLGEDRHLGDVDGRAASTVRTQQDPDAEPEPVGDATSTRTSTSQTTSTSSGLGDHGERARAPGRRRPTTAASRGPRVADERREERDEEREQDGAAARAVRGGLRCRAAGPRAPVGPTVAGRSAHAPRLGAAGAVVAGFGAQLAPIDRWHADWPAGRLSVALWSPSGT